MIKYLIFTALLMLSNSPQVINALTQKNMVGERINSDADSLSINTIEFEKELPGCSSRVTVEFPLGENNRVHRAVMDYILDVCINFAPGVEVTQPSNTCDVYTFKRYLEEYTITKCLLSAQDQHDYALSFGEDGEQYKVQWFSNLFIQKTADTDLYVSYAVYHGEFAGGAHDERGSGAVTIRKSDGVRINDFFVEDAEENMQPLLWKYLIASESPDNEQEFIAEINKFLKANYNIENYLHLPYGSIYLANDGIHIMYQPLEICFWPGEPELVIPYDEAKTFLTPEVSQLVF